MASHVEDDRSGQGGIRTHETREGPPVFKTGSFNRSDTCPRCYRFFDALRRLPYGDVDFFRSTRFTIRVLRCLSGAGVWGTEGVIGSSAGIVSANAAAKCGDVFATQSSFGRNFAYRSVTPVVLGPRRSTSVPPPPSVRRPAWTSPYRATKPNGES
jgi:hypothetical protein